MLANAVGLRVLVVGVLSLGGALVKAIIHYNMLFLILCTAFEQLANMLLYLTLLVSVILY